MMKNTEMKIIDNVRSVYHITTPPTTTFLDLSFSKGLSSFEDQKKTKSGLENLPVYGLVQAFRYEYNEP